MTKNIKEMGFPTLVKNSESLLRFKNELTSTLRLSLTGMVNLVVKYEDPTFINEFLKSCFKLSNLYRNTYNIDAVEMQQGKPGKGIAAQYLDELIYGSVRMSTDASGFPSPVLDGRTGERIRESDGFINRPEIINGNSEEIFLIVNNIDLSADFCPDDIGEVCNKASGIFYKFRRLELKKNCRLILVTNEKIKLPFEIPSVTWPGMTQYEAQYLLDGVIEIYKTKYQVNISPSQQNAICRKIVGLNFSSSSDCVATAFQRSVDTKNGIVVASKVLKNLRHKINSSFMEKGNGLTSLEPRPWEDYICPETSSFTHDVKKLMKDFEEIRDLKKVQEEKSLKMEDTSDIDYLIEAIECRIPKVIVLYGKGGTGKSAMPVHLAGLLDFDVWDFNIGATHSKWVGEGAKQMREALDQILKTSHVVVRIDEYDRAMGSTSDSGEGMHEAHKQVESEFMNWLQNNQESNTFAKRNIIVVLTTNHKENITGPLLRSGRADLVISIDNFDSKSVVETLKTTGRRMNNRGIKAIGYPNPEDLQKKIDSMDLEACADAMQENGFTVRDIETLVLEMARHDYYFKKDGSGISWTKENFIRICQLSSGSIATDGNSTKELELGDRKFLSNKEETEDKSLQVLMPFMEEKEEYINASLISGEC